MELTLPERIQLLRKRLGLNQGQFGAMAFNTSVETGRTKIKNIELGKQAPSAEDLAKMAKVLDVPTTVLAKMASPETEGAEQLHRGVIVDASVLERFENLEPYLDMLNRAVSMKDEELIAHIAEKLSDVFARQGQLKAVNG